MSITFTRAALAATALLLPIASPAAEFLSNNSFEKYHGHGFPWGWDLKVNAGALVTTAPGDARTGATALLFDGSVSDGPEWGHRVFEVTPGETYRITFWHKTTEAFSSGSVVALARWWGSADRSNFLGQVEVDATLGSTVTGGWVEVQADVTPPPGVFHADISFWGNTQAFGPEGRLLVDDVSWKTLPIANPPATSPSPTDGADSRPLYETLGWTVADSDAVAAHLFLSESWQEATAASAPGDPGFVDSVPVDGAGAVQYAVTLPPYRRNFWRVVAEDSTGALTAGPVWSFETGFPEFEVVPGSTFFRYDLKDNAGRGMDVLQVIERPDGPGYIGVYHNIPDGNGRFDLQLGTSTNLRGWIFERTLAPNADMPDILWNEPNGRFYMTYEQWGNPFSTVPSNLGFRSYEGMANLLAGNAERIFVAPLSPFATNNIEGTPNLFSVSPDGNEIEVGLHYFDNPVDRNARGTLTNFQAGSPSWTASVATQYNNDLIVLAADANIGDRDNFTLYGREYIIQEAQYVVGDFGSWRPFLYDVELDTFIPLFTQTHQGSRASGNFSTEVLEIPEGGEGLVIGAFVFSELSKPGEAGQLLYYKSLPRVARGPVPADGAALGERPDVLRWLSGSGVVQHHLYAGIGPLIVENATPASPAYQGAVDRPLWDGVDSLTFDTVYWRVDQEAENGVVTKGPVWSFTRPADLPSSFLFR